MVTTNSELSTCNDGPPSGGGGGGGGGEEEKTCAFRIGVKWANV